ncbi:MAG TPA: VanZ family protein [Bacteroidales bacterium]|nr:VanZ family protein [Bacteroidales bacterium]HPS15776.1 VanZ family protein [Bacteroidales bacterium]
MFFRYNLWGILWGLFILVLIGLPGENIPDVSLWRLLQPDKIFHSVIFGIFVLLLIVGFKKQHTYINLHYHAKWHAVVFGIIYGVITELLQLIIFTHRTADIIDIIADSIGCLLGLLTFNFIYWKEKVNN